jgi:hypothetical protein
VTPSDAGRYCVEVFGTVGSATNCATLTVFSSATLTLQLDGAVLSAELPPADYQATNPVCVVFAQGAPESLLRATLTNVSGGFSIVDGVYPSWCVDYYGLLDPGIVYKPILYRTDHPLPARLQDDDWDLVNYILNHKQGTWMDVQGAIWHFIGGPVPNTDASFFPPSATTCNLIADALAHGEGFAPGPGELTSVILDLGPSLQANVIEIRCPAGMAFLGEPATLHASANGVGPFTYRWFKTGSDTVLSDSDTLTLHTVTAEHGGEYRVEATGACGTATNCVTLAIVPAVRAVLSVVNGVPRLVWNAEPGTTYRVQCKDILGNSPWTNLPGDVVAEGPICVKEDLLGPAAQRFYRVGVLPKP